MRLQQPGIRVLQPQRAHKNPYSESQCRGPFRMIQMKTANTRHTRRGMEGLGFGIVVMIVSDVSSMREFAFQVFVCGAYVRRHGGDLSTSLAGCTNSQSWAGASVWPAGISHKCNNEHRGSQPGTPNGEENLLHHSQRVGHMRG